MVALGIAALRGAVAAPESGLAQVAHLLGGGVSGFLALAFPPTWPALAAILGMLVVRGIRGRSGSNIGMLAAGFGAAWTLILGNAIVSAATDPAVFAADVTGWFAIGVSVLLAGLLTLSVAAVGRSTPRDD